MYSFKKMWLINTLGLEGSAAVIGIDFDIVK